MEATVAVNNDGTALLPYTPKQLIGETIAGSFDYNYELKVVVIGSNTVATPAVTIASGVAGGTKFFVV